MADSPIPGDKYVRTLSHYLRSNQRRLLPPTPPPVPAIPASFAATTAAQARSLVTPVDPMAAAYENMVSSLWSATAAVVSSITPSSSTDRPVSPQERDVYTGAWDGTGAVLPDSNPSERQLYLSAQLRSPIFPLDLYYLLYLLERFEQVGIDLEGWNGTTAKPVGDSKPRVIMQENAQKRHSIAIVTPAGVNSGLPNSASFSSFPPPATANGGIATTSGVKNNRPESIRSFQSAALSTLTLITGWKQWSTAASSSSSNLTITDDVHFIQKFMRHIPSLRLAAKIPPGEKFQGKGRIEGFGAEAILTLFNHGHPVPTPGGSNGGSTSNGDSVPLFLLPLAATFPALTHLELHKIPPDSVEGWTELMKQLKSLVILQSGMEDVYDIMVKSVIDSERRRRERMSREKSRAVLIQKEQEEALKDAALTSQELEIDSTAKDDTPSSNGSDSSTASSRAGADPLESDAVILSSLKMWPVLRHLSLSDNSLPTLAQNDTFVHTRSIVSLDLSHNLFLSPPSALIHLHNLHQLNLSYNMISGVQSIYQILGNIAVLDLRGNRLESLSGLERLWNLEKVDVRENHLDEAAEVGRLAALPGIREVWSERNPFCMIQPKHRLEILAVFKANGHDLMLDGSFASFTEKRTLANLSPSSFSTTISSINNVANIPSASAPIATFAKELARPEPIRHSRAPSKVDETPTAAARSPPGANGVSPPVSKLVKKKLVKSTKRVKRVVNLDSDHEEETMPGPDEDVKGLASLESDEDRGVSVQLAESKLGSSAVLEKKKKKKKAVKSSGSPTGEPTSASGGGGETNDVNKENSQKEKIKKKGTKKKIAGGATAVAAPVAVAPAAAVNFANDDNDPTIDHSLCRDDHHVHRHRLAHLESSIASKQLERSHTSFTPLVAPLASVPNSSAAGTPSLHQRHPSRGILKRNPTMPVNNSGAISPRLRPSSPIGSFCSDDGGADGYRRRIEAMRNEAGKNWLMVLAEMDKDMAREGEYAREHGEH
ncbi:hypothetical protein BGZ95_000869 [Linnemannia exigua]|uniref:Leucine rich repeat domain-containing protein n=1 Tax=Linnemannia exigua TaxID=604196 RepID=A0AAD4DLD5_9FUNG|nr:hypothetical protein BGZ95_000869 [Linnemannia exigua]